MRKPLVGKKIAKDTYDDNALTGRYIKEFMKSELHRNDIYLHEVRLGFIQDFHTFLLTEKKNRQNSCSKHLKFLKQLMNIAVSNGYIQFNPLNIYKVEREPVEIDFLDDTELRKIINFTTPLYKAIKECEESKTPRVKNGFGVLWLGCVIDSLGGDWEKYRCRGEIIDCYFEDDKLIIDQWTAWCEQEGFREFIEERFPGTKVYFRDEEPGLENYTTNSFEHFPERYFLDTSEDSMYFESLEEAAEYVEDMVGHKVEADVTSIRKALSDYEDEHKEEKWMYYSFHEFKLAD